MNYKRLFTKFFLPCFVTEFVLVGLFCWMFEANIGIAFCSAFLFAGIVVWLAMNFPEEFKND